MVKHPPYEKSIDISYHSIGFVFGTFFTFNDLKKKLESISIGYIDDGF